MANIKYAIRFPDYQIVNSYQSNNLFSRDSIIKTTDIFRKNFDALGHLTDFLVQRNRTNELSKQINAQKRAIDVSVDNLKEQKRIEFEEYTKKLQIQLRYEKEKMEIEIKKLVLEASSKVNDFSVSFEENMKSNQVLHNLIIAEAQFLESIKVYIDGLAADFSHRKEYVVYCELQRKSLDLVKKYMAEMI